MISFGLQSWTSSRWITLFVPNPCPSSPVTARQLVTGSGKPQLNSNPPSILTDAFDWSSSQTLLACQQLFKPLFLSRIGNHFSASVYSTNLHRIPPLLNFAANILRSDRNRKEDHSDPLAVPSLSLCLLATTDVGDQFYLDCPFADRCSWQCNKFANQSYPCANTNGNLPIPLWINAKFYPLSNFILRICSLSHQITSNASSQVIRKVCSLSLCPFLPHGVLKSPRERCFLIWLDDSATLATSTTFLNPSQVDYLVILMQRVQRIWLLWLRPLILPSLILKSPLPESQKPS